MARVTPSDIKKYLDTAMPTLADKDSRCRAFSLDSHTHPGLIQATAALIWELDEALLPKDPDDYVKFVAAHETVQSAARATENGKKSLLDKVVGYGDLNPLAIIREVLDKCPDEVIPESTEELPFVSEPDYREMLRRDLASVEIFFSAREWKAAMVISGSLIEALLWYRLNLERGKAEETLKGLHQDGTLEGRLPQSMDNWHLRDYVHVAYKIDAIQERTKKSALLAGEYRNLIHPGKIVREKAKCTKGIAFSAFGAVLEVIEDLTKMRN